MLVLSGADDPQDVPSSGDTRSGDVPGTPRRAGDTRTFRGHRSGDTTLGSGPINGITVTVTELRNYGGELGSQFTQWTKCAPARSSTRKKASNVGFRLLCSPGRESFASGSFRPSIRLVAPVAAPCLLRAPPPKLMKLILKLMTPRLDPLLGARPHDLCDFCDFCDFKDASRRLDRLGWCRLQDSNL